MNFFPSNFFSMWIEKDIILTYPHQKGSLSTLV